MSTIDPYWGVLDLLSLPATLVSPLGSDPPRLGEPSMRERARAKGWQHQ